MDFLLECIGFPPDTDLEALARRVEREGEPAPWRGPAGLHKRLSLAGGLELFLDREEGRDFHTLMPQCRAPHRLRVAVREVARVPDSPFDALIHGQANPPLPDHADERDALEEEREAFELCAYLTDRRRVPRDLPAGHVLALSLAGFAVDVSWIGPNEAVRDRSVLELPRGARLTPLGGLDDPGGCMDVSLRVRELRHVRNPLSGASVEVIEADAPGRPLVLFVSRWQLERDGLPAPRPGWRIEGTFLLSGRVAGGLPGPAERGEVFG